jgi:hypothetical protein
MEKRASPGDFADAEENSGETAKEGGQTSQTQGAVAKDAHGG